MKRSSTRDFIVGLFVLAGLISLGFLSVRVGGASFTGTGGMTIYAHFDDVGGLRPRSKVTISGVSVGQVESITIDDDYRARVEMDVRPDLELPTDTSASVLTSGMLGDQYLALQLGAEEQLLKNGDTITFTESAVSLERMIGKMVHGTDLE